MCVVGLSFGCLFDSLTPAEKSHPVLKKRRISADKAIALSWKGGDLDNAEKENFEA